MRTLLRFTSCWMAVVVLVVVAAAIAASASSSKGNHVLLSDVSNLSVKGQTYFSS
jgi:hypothetical protein